MRMEVAQGHQKEFPAEACRHRGIEFPPGKDAAQFILLGCDHRSSLQLSHEGQAMMRKDMCDELDRLLASTKFDQASRFKGKLAVLHHALRSVKRQASPIRGAGGQGGPKRPPSKDESDGEWETL